MIEALELAGVGALMALLEARRKKLAAEGLFDAARKRKVPFLPMVVGVVTSPTGAVIRDILHRLADRVPVGLSSGRSGCRERPPRPRSQRRSTASTRFVQAEPRRGPTC